MRDETHHLFNTKFGGVKLLEGYGATEAAPVVAVNHPDRNRPGTVGQLLPGMEARLEPVEGITEGGRLFLRGPNVMAGYMSPDDPTRIEPLDGGWHDTGDIVDIDEEGYIAILGRVKRFAKIGGEMVSLSAVEGLARPSGPRTATRSSPSPTAARARNWSWSPSAATPTSARSPNGPAPTARPNWRCPRRSSGSATCPSWAPARPTMSRSSRWWTSQRRPDRPAPSEHPREGGDPVLS